MVVVTTGNHRYANVTERSQFGVLQQVVPGATVYVTVTSTGLAATIYSDPGMTIVIPGALITTDTSGFYEYYLPVAYNVTEQITAPSGMNVTISNIVLNGNVLVGSLTTTASATDTVTLTGVTASSHVSLTATNAAAAAMIAATYVSSKSANTLVITHPASSGATFDIIATAN
jgi:hypothetical protein